jgi:hypothetical protein
MAFGQAENYVVAKLRIVCCKAFYKTAVFVEDSDAIVVETQPYTSSAVDQGRGYLFECVEWGWCYGSAFQVNQDDSIVRAAEEGVLVKSFYVLEHEFRHVRGFAEQADVVVFIGISEELALASEPDAVIFMMQAVKRYLLFSVRDIDLSESFFIAAASKKMGVCKHPETSIIVKAHLIYAMSYKKGLFVLKETISIEAI